MNYYERHIGDYLKDTAHLSLLEHGVYTRLLDVYYTRELPFGPGEAVRLVGARTKEERAAVESILAEFFVDGRQPRCDREIERYQAKVEHNQRVGKLGGRPRKAETQEKPTGLSPGSETLTQPEPEPNPPSLQTPDTTQVSEKPSGERGKPRPARKCPDSFVVTPELRRWAAENAPGVSVELETAKFRDHTFSTTCIDWPGRWRNWLRKSGEFTRVNPADVARVTVPSKPSNGYLATEKPMTPEEREKADAARIAAVGALRNNTKVHA